MYTTSEGVGQVQMCAVLMAPGPAIALRDFVLSSTTASGTASMFNDTPYILVGNMPLLAIAAYNRHADNDIIGQII